MIAPMHDTDGGTTLPAGQGCALGYDERAYHRGLVWDGGQACESLSVSRAKLLVPPSTPAHFAAWRPEHKPVFDFGRAAHERILGVGAPMVEIPTEDMRTKTARGLAAQARLDGAVPLKTADYRTVVGMADALAEHATAADLLTGRGWPEVSMWAPDPEVGVWLRGRADYVNLGRGALVDYKTTARPADPDRLGKTVWDYHYEMQAAWYLDLAAACAIPVDRFVFVFQEKVPPYPVSVVSLDETALDVGRRENADAIRLYAACVETGRWPGYPDRVETVSLPAWAAPAMPSGISADLAEELAWLAT